MQEKEQKYRLTNEGQRHVYKRLTRIRSSRLLNPPTHGGKGRILLKNMASKRLLGKSLTQGELNEIKMVWVAGEEDPKKAFSRVLLGGAPPIYMSPKDKTVALQWAIQKGYIREVGKPEEMSGPLRTSKASHKIAIGPKFPRITPKRPKLRR